MSCRQGQRRLFRGFLRLALGGLVAWAIIAYLVMPQIDRWHAQRRPGVQRTEPLTLTRTGSGLPADPLNLALAGSENDVVRALLAAGWLPADALSFRSSLRIAVDTVLDEPDPDAPVSHLYLYGRREDLAFEKPSGHSPRARHHVRLWQSPESDGGRPLWLAAATHDTGVELSHTTAEVTHRISPDIDAERDLLITDLTAAKRVLGTRWIDGYHHQRQGRNGGGDPWHTDGRLAVVTLIPTP